MSAAEDQVVAALKANATIISLLSDGASPPSLFRIEPMIRAQETALPAITYQRVANVPSASLDGNTGNLDQARIQIDCWSLDYDQAKTLAGAVRTAMATLEAYLLNDFDDYSDETATHRCSLDFSVWVRL